MVCASISPQHTQTCVVIFHAGKSCVVFRRADSLFLWIAGVTRWPGSVHGFSCLFSGCASFCGAACRSFDLTAGVASISPWKSGGVVLARPCVEVLVSRQALRRFLLGSRAALSLRGRASKFRAHGRRCVDFFLEVGRRCPCEAVRQSFGRPEGVASISVGVRHFSCRGVSCVSKISAHGASK
ncbi:hypothetical protein NDU88_004241 [Pleurodeles waltl]|uniref:Uncharacterized protein n=1 Tax=Pleurodeles waltl TaxID=8319 RepID=A0AAV7LKU2_PLEWA|nr:hypothetical protein NDU88_004241 [Pleurodeles waltl]